ncbi:MAG: penicillin-binding protein 2 [Burkholderiaceae bacterium]|nr:penicillin-binding protein 2 [Burkholderiaceae bacterium]MCD8517817.1 penicillin-binding protein 2 [Burkholderiaceae bacterium]MCD8537225.1 penicillin-binding protein 2 [Burkholderiaceae bacterium]MCD8564641.1 penicillin-binding protein 2 [Burkholderiaceae bacterium]
MFDFKSATEKERSRFGLRLWVAGAVVLLAFGLLGWRLWVLQVQQHQGLLQRADNNRTAVVPIAPRRGEILDRNGEVLARNYLSYTLDVVPAQVDSMDQLLTDLQGVIAISDRQKRQFERRLRESGPFAQVLLRNDLSDTEAAFFAAQAFRFPAVQLRARWVRQYPQGESAAHVVGYIARISENDLQQLDANNELGNYRGTDIIGKKGIEKSWERYLHGQTGIESLEVTARGKPVQTLHRIDPIPGNDLILSIDLRLQRIAEEAFAGQRGALVAIDPNNGEVLAFVSQPSFDPNLFVDGIDHESWKQLNESEDKPLITRPVYGTYPIGSTYKPFVALAAMALGKRTPNTRIYDPGYYEMGKTRFRNAGSVAYGNVDVHKSLVVSSDTYYYSLAEQITIDALHDFMKPFSFGQKTGIDLVGERVGILPSTDWKKSAFKDPEQQRWYPGETVSVLIGQGYNSFSLMQLAQATAVLANGGTYYRPHLVRAVKRSGSLIPEPVTKEVMHTIDLDPKGVEAVRDALIDVAKVGTARRAFAGATYEVAGKTGTIQLFNLKGAKYKRDEVDERLRDHSAFMGYAPAINPTIALAVLVENAGWGSEVAAPIARKVFDAWLKPDTAEVASALASDLNR